MMEKFPLGEGSSSEEEDESNEVPDDFIVSFNFMNFDVLDSFWESTEEETGTSNQDIRSEECSSECFNEFI